MLQQVSRREGRMRGNHATGACGRQQLTTGHWHSSLQQQQPTPVAGFGNLKQSQKPEEGERTLSCLERGQARARFSRPRAPTLSLTSTVLFLAC